MTAVKLKVPVNSSTTFLPIAVLFGLQDVCPFMVVVFWVALHSGWQLSQKLDCQLWCLQPPCPVTQETLCHRQMVGITHLWKNLPLQVLTRITMRTWFDNRIQQSIVLTFKPLTNFSCTIGGLSSTDLLQLSANESSNALICFIGWLLIDSLDVGCTVVVWINGTIGMEEW